MNVVNCLLVEVDTGQASCLTGAIAHVREVVTANFATLGNFDLNDEWAVEHKALFDADTTGNAANRDAAGVAALHVGTDNETLEDLHTLFVAFADFLVHLNGVAATHVDDGWLLVLFVDFLDNTLHIRQFYTISSSVATLKLIRADLADHTEQLVHSGFASDHLEHAVLQHGAHA